MISHILPSNMQPWSDAGELDPTIIFGWIVGSVAAFAVWRVSVLGPRR